MSRPRIRSLKPEMWADEKIGALSRDARLLFVGLITMADDEGRLRAMPAAIVGHCFPYDDVAPSRLAKWIAELCRAGLLISYSHDDRPYLAFRHWRKHQRVNRATRSALPPPPDRGVWWDNMTEDEREEHPDRALFLTERSVNAHGEVIELSRRAS